MPGYHRVGFPGKSYYGTAQNQEIIHQHKSTILIPIKTTELSRASNARINEHNTHFNCNQQNEMSEILIVPYAAIERIFLSMLDTTDH